MPFPTIAGKGTTYSNAGTAGTSHPIDLPNGLGAGDRVLIAASKRTNGGFTWPSSPAWTLVAAVDAPSNNAHLDVYFRDLDGTEGWTDGSSIELTTGAAVKAVGFPWLIRGHHPGTAPAVATATGSGTANPDPPNLDPSSWATEDTLWIACHCRGLAGTTDAYPADFTSDQEQAVSGGASPVGAAICSRNLAAGNLDPGAFTVSGTVNWGAVTIAIRPSVLQELAGNVPAAVDLDGTLGLALPASGVVASAAHLTGDLQVTRGLAGTVPAAAGVTGQLGALAALAGVIPAAVDLDGTLATNLGRRPRLLIVED